MRTLERKLGALCRAVAVRVAEMKLKKNSDEPNVESIENVGDMRSNETTDGGVGGVSCPLPPQLPILLDEAALEDILGVRHLNSKPYFILFTVFCNVLFLFVYCFKILLPNSCGYGTASSL